MNADTLPVDLQAALIVALEELARWPELPAVPYAVEVPDHRDPTIRRPHVIHPTQIRGVFVALEKHVKTLLPFGAEIVEKYKSRYTDRFYEARRERERCLQDVAAEEELDGDPPPEFLAEYHRDPVNVLRATVRATKRGIAERIRAREIEVEP